MELLSSIQRNFNKINISLQNSLKRIESGGYTDTVQNKIEFLKNENFQSIKDREISAIDTANLWMNQYDSALSSITDFIIKYKVSSMKENSNSEKDGLLTSINNILNTKFKGENLFQIDSDLVIGDGITAKKTFDKSWIQYEGQNITDVLKNADLDTIDKVFNFVSNKQAEVGARTNVLTNTKSFYTSLKSNQDEFTSNKIYDLSKALTDFSNLKLSYETLSIMASKVSSLSLVNYL